MNRDDTDAKDAGLEAASGSPAAGALEKPESEYEIDIFRDWCKSCGICAAFCPRKCLSLDAHGSPVVEPSKRCSGCRWCELHCPDFAICVRELESGEQKEQGEPAD
jgi:2-oxoglutarate ferredoxin oxidoreductase subunit delta